MIIRISPEQACWIDLEKVVQTQERRLSAYLKSRTKGENFSLGYSRLAAYRDSLFNFGNEDSLFTWTKTIFNHLVNHPQCGETIKEIASAKIACTIALLEGSATNLKNEIEKLKKNSGKQQLPSSPGIPQNEMVVARFSQQLKGIETRISFLKNSLLDNLLNYLKAEALKMSRTISLDKSLAETSSSSGIANTLDESAESSPGIANPGRFF